MTEDPNTSLVLILLAVGLVLLLVSIAAVPFIVWMQGDVPEEEAKAKPAPRPQRTPEWWQEQARRGRHANPPQ